MNEIRKVLTLRRTKNKLTAMYKLKYFSVYKSESKYNILVENSKKSF